MSAGTENARGVDLSRQAGAIAWDYDRHELVADGIIHVVGICFGVVGGAALIVRAGLVGASVFLAIGVYGVGFASMFLASAAFNMWPVCPTKWLLRRIDHSTIYLLIAATYAPFIGELGSFWLRLTFYSAIWTVAALGILIKLLCPGRFDGVSIAIYLAMGWSGMALYHDLFAGLPRETVRLVFAGGIVYTLGVPFHLWQRLRFQNAIWHLFVLVAAACHYTAVLVLLEHAPHH